MKRLNTPKGLSSLMLLLLAFITTVIINTVFAQNGTWSIVKAPIPALQGEQGINHLKHQGSYASLHEAINAVRHRVVPGPQTTANALIAAGAVDPLMINPALTQEAYLKASNTGFADQFGWSVAVSGDTAVVGAPQEDSGATGVDGNQNDNSFAQAGAAYVFVRSGGVWSQQGYLKASNTGASDQFGYSVAISGDTIVVGARGEDSNATGVDGNQSDNSAADSGAAYVFTRSGGTWSQQAYLKASNTSESAQFSFSVAVSGDTVVVGATGEPSNATGVNGNQNDNSANFAGAAYVFTRSGGVWSQQAYLKASNTEGNDLFGWSVAVSGDTTVIGALIEASNATGVDGNQNDNSANQAGAAYVFTRIGSVWSQQAYLKASNTGATDWFGNSLAVSGDTVVVGAVQEDSNATGVGGDQNNNSATNSGAAYVFSRSAGIWSQQAYLKASNTGAFDAFGTSVATSGDAIVVGAPQERSNATGLDGNQSSNEADVAGAAYAFLRSGGIWSQQAYIKASNTAAFANFGTSVSVSDGTFLVGAFGEASNATGVNGNQSDNSANSSGAAYVYGPVPDGCPNDPNKIAPGVCGCGVADTDSDHDGTADCNDACPNDPNKIAPGVCGCGVADTDTDHDGTPNCNDACPNDPNKIAPGVCGCGVADTDTDDDGTADCNDACPNDPNKIAPGVCGCGVADTDTDHDGTPNCIDACPNDPNKIAPGVCGCGVPDTDSDGDGIPNCLDNCPTTFNPDQRDINGDGIGDACTPFQFPDGAQFVIGDLVNQSGGATVNFWGSQWLKNNPMSGGSGPNAFKGFENGNASPTCGSTWTSQPGNSSNPPATVPRFMGVIVSSLVVKNGKVITGNIKKIVVVETNAGYGPAPGQLGTGRVVAVVCTSP